MNHKTVWSIVGVLTLFVVIGYGIYMQRNEEVLPEKQEVTENTTDVPEGPSEFQTDTSAGSDMPVETNVPSISSTPHQDIPYEVTALDESPDTTWQLIKTEVGGTKIVLIDDIRKTIQVLYTPPAGVRQPNTFRIVSLSTSTQKLFLVTSIADSDAPTGVIFAFDPVTHTFTRVSVADAYRSWVQVPVMSPDGARTLSFGPFMATDSRGTSELYVLDFAHDTAKKVFALTGDEVFVKGYDSFAHTPLYEWRWVDNDTVEVSIFDHARKTQNEYGDDMYVVSRVITLDV